MPQFVPDQKRAADGPRGIVFVRALREAEGGDEREAGVVVANATMIVSELLADWSSKYEGPIGKILGARVPSFGFVAAGFNPRPAK